MMRVPFSGETFSSWAQSLVQVLQPWARNIEDTKFTQGQVLRMKAYAVAGLPAASANVDAAVICSDEAGGRTIVTSDGTNWRRVSNGAIAS